MLAAIKEKTKLDGVARAALDTCLSELLENVMIHADTEHGGVAAVQAFESELELAIVDLGIGIPASLAKNPHPCGTRPPRRLDSRPDGADPERYVDPRTPERNAGWGLAFTELLLELNEGRMHVRSGAGHVVRGAKIANRTELEPLPGTLVVMRIKTDRPLDYSRAWELLDAAIGNVETYVLDDFGTGGASEAG